MLNRAWSTLELKAVDDEQRIVEGIASTPSPDRHGDIMDPKGAQFALPIPFLWFHNQKEPIGEIFEAKVSLDGIRIKARISKIDDAGKLKDRLDEAWQSIKSKLVRGLSVGWSPVDYEPVKGTTYVRFTKWVWAELSAVTIPMNTEASIVSVKHFDQAATGLHHSPGVSGSPATKGRTMTIQEQITGFEHKRAASAARMNELMSTAAGAGVTLDDEQTKEYDSTAQEVKAIDAHLVRLKALEVSNVAAATAITAAKTVEDGSNLRGGIPVVTMKGPVLPKGTAFVRYACALAMSRGNKFEAAEYAKRWESTTPEVTLALKAAVNPGTTVEPAWAAPLVAVTPLASEFLELLRPATLIGKIPGLRMVPFNISAAVQTGGGTYGFVGEGAPKPVGNLQLTSATLPIAKAAGIIVISQELARLSSPRAEDVVRTDMVNGMAEFLDGKFIDPTNAGVAGVEPASITNAAVSVGSAGTSGANAETDFKNLVGSMIAVNQSIAGLVLIMSESNALNLSLARTTNGEFMFPNLSAGGGSIAGIAVVTSQKAGTTVALVSPRDILMADDGGVDIDVSTQAAVELNTVPTSPVSAASVLVSLWQNNLIGLKAERFINWKRARLAGVRYTTATYV